MDLSHRFVVPASVEETWEAFNDLESIAPCFPGATLTSVDGDQFTGSVKIKLGPIAMQYNGTGAFLERDEGARRAVIEAKGKDKRGNGTAGATVVAQLTPDGAGTAVEVSTDLSVTGKPAQFGRGVIQDVSDKLLGMFVECIAAKLQDEPADVVRDDEGSPAGGASPSDDAAAPVLTSVPGNDEVAESSGRAQEADAAVERPRPSVAATALAEPVELDLGRTVAPVLLRRYGVPAGVALVVAVVVFRLIRR